MKDLKLNFLFVVLFAPVLPWAIIPTLLARVMEVRLKITCSDCIAAAYGILWDLMGNAKHLTRFDAFVLQLDG